jgi:serine/threonine protein kinase
MLNYLILGNLGHGGMAKVYLAEHKSLGHKVAIKVLNKEFFHNDNIRKRFLAEAKSLAGMNHANIVRVTDLIEENESAAFVMEHIEGRTLRDYLEEKGKLSDDEIKQLFGQMLDAVGYVHEQGLIHRDIKPSNFMLDGRGNIKLLDFGIAKAKDATSSEYTQTGTGIQMGTPMYMSPEQVKESRSVTAQSDIYSLGVVLWQMVAGKKPYDVTTLSDFDMKTKIVNEPLPKTGTGWDEVIKKATAKNLNDRFLQIQNVKQYELQTEKSNPTKPVKPESTVIESLKRIRAKDKLDGTIIENKKPKSPVWMDEELKSICQEYKIKDYQNKKLFEILREVDNRNFVDYTRLKDYLNQVSIRDILINKPEFFFKKTDFIDKVASKFFAFSIVFIFGIIISIILKKLFSYNVDFSEFMVAGAFIGLSIYFGNHLSYSFYSEIPEFNEMLNNENAKIKDLLLIMERIDLKYEVENRRTV